MSIHAVINNLSQVILGKEKQIKLALACLLARGHLLIEDLPGMGKTTLSHALAVSLGLSYQRIQFTSDLLPADIIGTSIFDLHDKSFSFHQGPLFNQVILADEINRAGPKTQSALLEAMEEHQVSIDGHTYDLPSPFFVIATQNPIYQAGTFPLPESQLDRFLMKLSLGYPSQTAEKEILLGKNLSIDALSPVLSFGDFINMQSQVHHVNVAHAVIDYVLAIVTYTREPGRYMMPLSPRASLALINAAKAWAFIENRDFVTPDDVQAILPSVIEHRLNLNSNTADSDVIRQLLIAVPVPL
ncbi:AAA family ATPase [Pseudoalteromonas tunicata]|jgi:MoxR-like ATPase|uniref:MoxR protein n=1 Tax=Pseudoalteromonas tunicata D2 TaxID=87626 RepID=A4C9L0_9GAMM|nr:MoxR family ATPase [Pseudoalteromonas tunicata]ATC94614.1 MoxR-like ATPase [Pseudoalteromonas tunicata]AXT30336.1 MoxR family ATPase [Pseudoalteromonas tunicata]EAR28068.1 MoxR protein [Pseudoalteromonas tunicata D2]MDP4982757.1 MoxR family ATPase [Pseudoalteromonas tunicata]